MSRPLKQGNGVVAQDISQLAKVLRRAEEDPHRPHDSKRALVVHLKGAIAILMQERERLTTTA